MATNGPSKQIQKAREVSKTLLSLNNSAVSVSSDRLFSLLEGGQDTTYLRNHLADIMDQISQGGSVEFNWAELRKLGSIKDQLAYLAGSKYGDLVQNGGVTGVTSIDDTNWGADNDIAVRKQLDEIISTIEENLLNHQDFSESWIVRHAATNRFEVKLNEKERIALNNLASSFKKIAIDEGFDVVAETMHFHSESDAQKIMKLSEAVGMLGQAGVKIDSTLMDQYAKLNEKIKPLRDLDKHYKHMTAMMHAVHDANKNYTLGLTTAQEEKMLSILAELGVTDPTEFLIRADDENPLNLKQKLLLLKNKNLTKFTKTLEKNGIKESAFTKQFVGYYSYKNLEQAKTDFQAQKIKTFGTKLPMFEQDVNQWRGHARNRVLDVHNRMTVVGGYRVFATDEDKNFVSSYFTKFRDLFYASEQDPENHDKMREIIAALIRTRVPLLTPGSRKFGVAIKNGWKQLFRKTPIVNKPHLDDAEWIAEIIMNDHLLTNDFYHGNNDIFHTDEKKVEYTRALRASKIGKAGIKNVIAPATTTAAAVSEAALFGGAKLGLGLTRGVIKVGQGFTWLGKETFGALNNGLNNSLYKKGYKRWKTPLYPISAVSLMLEKGMDLANRGSKQLDKGGKKGIELINKGHARLIDLTNEGLDLKEDKKVKHMFQGLGRVWRNTNEFLGKKISEKQENEFQNAILGQQRSAVAAFLELSKVDNELGPLMQSAELCELLNFKDTGPYLFDEDGRTMNTERIEKDVNTPAAAGAAFEKSIQTQIEKLMKQADTLYGDANTANINAKRSGDVNKMSEADVDFAHAAVVRANTKIVGADIARLQPILKNPLDPNNNNQWRKSEMDGILTTLHNRLNDTGTGLLYKLRTEIGDSSNGLIKEVADARIKMLKAGASVDSHQSSIKATLRAIENIRNPNTNSQQYLNSLQANLAQSEAALQQAIQDKAESEEKYLRQSRELRNKKQLAAWFEIIDQFRANVQLLSDDMANAITNGADTKSLVAQMNSMAKNLDILLFPEEKTVASKDNEALKEKIKEIFNNTQLQESTKMQLIQALAA